MFLPCEKSFGQRGIFIYGAMTSGFQYRSAYSPQTAEIVRFFLHSDNDALLYYIILSLTVKTFHFIALYN